MDPSSPERATAEDDRPAYPARNVMRGFFVGGVVVIIAGLLLGVTALVANGSGMVVASGSLLLFDRWMRSRADSPRSH